LISHRDSGERRRPEGVNADDSAADRIDALASRAIEAVTPGMLVGLGAGKTAGRVMRLLAERVRTGELSIDVVAASDATEQECVSLGLNVLDFSAVEELDVLIDGADEVDRSLRVLKGSRGAITRERMLAWAAQRAVYIVGAHKVSERIGTRAALAVAVMAFGRRGRRSAAWG